MLISTDYGTDARHRCALRHHGSKTHGMDVEGGKEGRYLYSENGSHLAMYDDQDFYFSGLIDFLQRRRPTERG